MTFSLFKLKKNRHCEGGTTAAISNNSRDRYKKQSRQINEIATYPKKTRAAKPVRQSGTGIPIRAGMAKALADSEFTSIQERIEKQSTWLIGFGKGDNDLPYYLSSSITLIPI